MKFWTAVMDKCFMACRQILLQLFTSMICERKQEKTTIQNRSSAIMVQMSIIALRKQQIINIKLLFDGFHWCTASHPCGLYPLTYKLLANILRHFKAVRYPTTIILSVYVAITPFSGFFHLIAPQWGPHPILSPKIAIPSVRQN